MRSHNISIVLAASIRIRFWPYVAHSMHPHRGVLSAFPPVLACICISTTTGFGRHIKVNADTGSTLILTHKRSRLTMQLLNQFPDAPLLHRHTFKRSHSLIQRWAVGHIVSSNARVWDCDQVTKSMCHVVNSLFMSSHSCFLEDKEESWADTRTHQQPLILHGRSTFL